MLLVAECCNLFLVFCVFPIASVAMFATCCYLLLFVAICYYLFLLAAICCYLLLLVAVCFYLLLFFAARRCNFFCFSFAAPCCYFRYLFLVVAICCYLFLLLMGAVATFCYWCLNLKLKETRRQYAGALNIKFRGLLSNRGIALKLFALVVSSLVAAAKRDKNIHWTLQLSSCTILSLGVGNMFKKGMKI